MSNIDVQHFEQDTYLIQQFPWGLYVGGAALCADGKVRKLKRISQTADTFFSVPASVTVSGHTVSGFVGIDSGVVKFHAYNYGRNGHLLASASL